MKFNWGYGILVFVVLFMTFILALVYQCSKQKVDLVSAKYYELELNYQQQVNKLNNAAAMDERLHIVFSRENQVVQIQFPSNTDRATLSGNVNFFKPDDALLDFNIPVQSNESREQFVPVSKLKKGWWKIQVSWASAGTTYYKEQKVLID